MGQTKARGAGSNWSEARARGVLREWAASGVTVRAFANERGIDPRRLYWWRGRLGDAAVEADPRGSGLVPVVVREAPVAPAARATVWTREGDRVEVTVLDEASARWVGLVLASAAGGRS